MTDYGMKVSQTGYDVKTATATQLAYSSRWSNFKIYSVVSGNATSSGGAFSLTIGNPLSYSPMFLAYIEETTEAAGKWQLASLGGFSGTVDVTTGPATMPQCTYRSGTNDFLCKLSNTTNTKVYTFKIAVFVDKLTGSSASLSAVDNYGIKISKSGQDVSSAFDTDLSMTSKFSNLTIAAAGTVTGNHSGSYPYLITVSHNLGYVPIYLTLVKDPNEGATSNTWYYMPQVVTTNVGGVDHGRAYVDSTNLYIRPGSVTDGLGHFYNLTYKYIIFNERIV